jgi:hypothetical protein
VKAISGYKTYIVAGVGVLALVAVNMLGVTIPGLAPSPDWVAQALGLLGLGALRAGVTKSGLPPP